MVHLQSDYEDVFFCFDSELSRRFLQCQIKRWFPICLDSPVVDGLMMAD